MAENRIDQRFAALRAEGKKAFVAYLTAGDPSLEATPGLVQSLEEAGADCVELGVPFSDPIADGVVIQLAFQRALDKGASLSGVLAAVARIRALGCEIPVVLFTYYNPVMRYGFEKFVTDSAASGADGVLVLDLPPEEAHVERALCEKHGLRWISLIAPTTPDERVPALASSASGFIYYVSREGVTGMQSSVSSSIPDKVALIRRHATAPVCVGFGISNPDQVRQVAAHADGVVVGSAIVKEIEKYATATDLCEKVRAFTAPMATAAHGS